MFEAPACGPEADWPYGSDRVSATLSFSSSRYSRRWSRRGCRPVPLVSLLPLGLTGRRCSSAFGCLNSAGSVACDSLLAAYTRLGEMSRMTWLLWIESMMELRITSCLPSRVGLHCPPGSMSGDVCSCGSSWLAIFPPFRRALRASHAPRCLASPAQPERAGAHDGARSLAALFGRARLRSSRAVRPCATNPALCCRGRTYVRVIEYSIIFGTSVAGGAPTGAVRTDSGLQSRRRQSR
mmetsp:Transcript_24066/g.61702  ORF Transcript_24066/g.61702 Transcript_24066/m.61702 type:complete len:238 (-) Transcript_24066:106-819(-)